MMRSENEMELGPDPVRRPEINDAAPLPEAPPEPVVRTRRRIPWFTLLVATVAVVAIGMAAVQTVTRSGLSRDLAATQVELDGANQRLSVAETQADGLRQQVEQGQSQLEDANAATRDVRTSLNACQDLFRSMVAIGGHTPTQAEASQAASDITSCFEGKFPPSLFP